MPPVTRGSFLPLLTPEMRRLYIQEGLERPMEHPEIVNMDDMPGNPITDRQFSGLGIMPAMGEGDRFPLDQPIQGSTVVYTATIFGLGYEVTRPAWEDDMYGLTRQMPGALARSSRYRMEVEAHAPFNHAFTSGFVGFDGLILCSTAHTRLDGGATQANRPTVDVGFSNTALQAGLLAFEAMNNERGIPRLMQPTNVLLTPLNKFNAREILGSNLKPFTTNNEINSLVEEELTYTIDHFITTTTNWFLMAAKGTHDVNFFIRSAPVFDSFDDPTTGNAIFTVWQRHTAGFGAWQGIYGSTG